MRPAKSIKRRTKPPKTNTTTKTRRIVLRRLFVSREGIQEDFTPEA